MTISGTRRLGYAAPIANLLRTAARHELDRTAAALLVVLCAIWGLNQVAVKITVAGISPALQAGLRSIGSSLLLIAWSRWRGVPLLVRDGTLWPGLAAGVLFSGEFVLLYWGISLTSASRAVLFLYTSPFAVAIGAHWFVPGDRLNGGRVAGLVVAFAGVLVALADRLRAPGGSELAGDLLCLGGAIAWGACTVLVKASRLRRASAERTLLYQLGVSSLVLPAIALAAGEPGVHAATPLVLACLAYQIAVVAFASYAVWFWLMSRYPASRLAAFTFLTPVFGVASGGLLLGEPIGPGLLLAMALVAAGIYLVNRPAAAPPTPPA